jgi:hypothetical protein
MLKSFVAALALVVGVGGQMQLQPPAREPAKPPPFVLGVVYREGGMPPTLTRLDPVSLERKGHGLRLPLGGATATAFSPNGSRLALGTVHPGIEIVDARRMKRLGFVKLRSTGWVTSLSWHRGTLFAVVSGETATTALVVDPIDRQVLQRHRLGRTMLATQPAEGVILLLTAPRRGIGPVELSVLGGKGIESVSVAGIIGGTRTTNDSDGFRAQQVLPALVVDSEQGRALIVSAGDIVATVDLGNLAVEYHDVSRSVSLLRRFRNWLEPAAEAKILEGPQREAVTLGGGLVAVTGVDYSEATSEPVGLMLMDTRDWSLRKLDDETTHAMRVGKTLLAYGERSGLVGYDLQGRKLFHRFEGRELDGIETAGGLVYLYPVLSGARSSTPPRAGYSAGPSRASSPLSATSFRARSCAGSRRAARPRGRSPTR